MRPTPPSRQSPHREIVGAGRRPIAPRLSWRSKAKEDAEKMAHGTKSVPQRPKPHCERSTCGTAKAVPLSKTIFSALSRGRTAGVFVLLLAASCFAQDKSSTPAQPGPPAVNVQLPVNWLYGAYIPKDAPIVPLTGKERFKLYIRQTYTTPGIYIKTGFFAIHDQVENSPPEWGDDFSGFAKRVGSNQATNIIQNSFTSLGQGVVGWEPRYDRCRCTGGWLRFRHAFVRNFITYGGSEQSIRPNIMPFAAAFGAGAIGATWNPGNPTIAVKGYQSVFTQAWVGVLTNSIGEFAPDLKKKFSKNKN